MIPCPARPDVGESIGDNRISLAKYICHVGSNTALIHHFTHARQHSRVIARGANFIHELTDLFTVFVYWKFASLDE